MGDLLAIEVVEGPMDGLKCILTDRMKSATIGREVGNSLTLGVDRAVSRRHARLVIEGPSWFIEDLGSAGGLWVSGRREKKTALVANQVILLGSTIIEVFVAEGSEPGVGLGEACFQDPRDLYGMSPEMEAVWRRFYQAGKQNIYCDISGLFVAWAGLEESSVHPYESVRSICSPDSWKCMGAWLPALRARPRYRIEPAGNVLVSPRVWHILDLASREKSRGVDAANFLQAVLDDKRSIPARYMAQDGRLLERFGLDCRWGVRSSVRGDEDRRKGSFFPSFATIHAAPSEGEREISGAAHAGDGEELSLLLARLERFEAIILGFLEDAIGPEMPMADFRLPGADGKLSDLWRQEERRRLVRYLDLLEKYLVGVLAAHRGAAAELEREIAARIKRIFETSAQGSQSGFLLRDSADEVRNAVFDVLKGVELEGLPERIIRERIRKISV